MVFQSIVEGARRIMCKHKGEKAWVGNTYHCLDCHAELPGEAIVERHPQQDTAETYPTHTYFSSGHTHGYITREEAEAAINPPVYHTGTWYMDEGTATASPLQEAYSSGLGGYVTTSHSPGSGSGYISSSSPLGSLGSAFSDPRMTGTWEQTTEQVQLQREYERAKKQALAQQMKKNTDPLPW